MKAGPESRVRWCWQEERKGGHGVGVTPQSSPAAGRAGAGVPEGWPPGEKLELTEDMRKVSKLKKWASLIINAQKT